MKKMNSTKAQNLQGGICVRPANAEANFCLPCAALIGSGNMMHASGPIICPL